MTYEEQQALLLRQQQEQQQLAQDINKIVDYGRLNHGAKSFDDDSAIVAEGLGNRAGEMMSIARNFDHPDKIITELAKDERRLRELARLDQARMAVELAKIESQFNPHGRPGPTGAKRVWQSTDTNGRLTKEAFQSPASDAQSDKAWNADYDRFQRGRRNRYK